jgi:hypothetical protein
MQTIILVIALVLFVLWVWLTWTDKPLKTIAVLILTTSAISAQRAESFYLSCDFYIATTGSDSTHYQKASIYMDSTEFYIIRGIDTTARRLCNFDPYYSTLALSCGDWVSPVRDWSGEVYALWYHEGGYTYYFNQKFTTRNKPIKE